MGIFDHNHDHCGPIGAPALAERIRLYWKSRGFEIETKAEPVIGAPIFQVRSNLLCGLPQKEAA